MGHFFSLSHALVILINSPFTMYSDQCSLNLFCKQDGMTGASSPGSSPGRDTLLCS